MPGKSKEFQNSIQGMLQFDFRRDLVPSLKRKTSMAAGPITERNQGKIEINFSSRIYLVILNYCGYHIEYHM